MKSNDLYFYIFSIHVKTTGAMYLALILELYMYSSPFLYDKSNKVS